MLFLVVCCLLFTVLCLSFFLSLSFVVYGSLSLMCALLFAVSSVDVVSVGCWLFVGLAVVALVTVVVVAGLFLRDLVVF